MKCTLYHTQLYDSNMSKSRTSCRLLWKSLITRELKTFDSGKQKERMLHCIVRRQTGAVTLRRPRKALSFQYLKNVHFSR